MKRVYFIYTILLLAGNSIYGQACCTAGTPILGSLDMSSTASKTLQLTLAYDYNNLSSVFAGSDKIDDNTRKRSTQSILLETSYGFNHRFSLTTLFSFVNQNRTINTFNQTREVATTGFGDALVLLKYNLLSSTFFDQTTLSFGAGVKLPTGKADLKSNGILLPADMQPGSGSVDYMVWGFYSKGFSSFTPLTLIANASYKINGANNRFANSDAGYSFGDEVIISAGAGYRTDNLFDFSLFARVRSTQKDLFDKEKVPNTGGFWFYLVPGINLKLSNKLTARSSSQIPVYRNLIGTQLTTSYTVSISFFYSYSFNQF